MKNTEQITEISKKIQDIIDSSVKDIKKFKY